MPRQRKDLSPRHLGILSFLIKYQKENNYPPTIRELGEAINVPSTSLIDYYLKRLVKERYIERTSHTSRGFRVINVPNDPGLKEAFASLGNVVETAANEIYQVPHWGTIFASEPIQIPGEATIPDTFVDVSRSLLPAREDPEGLFALEVKGDSMIDALIGEGDIVILRKTSDFHNGEMVAVWLEDEHSTTLKYIYVEKERIRLQPANPTMGPIYIDKKRPLRVEGKVVLVIRKMEQTVPYRGLRPAQKPVLK